MYQNTEQKKESMLGGSYKVEMSPMAADHHAATWSNLGAVNAPSIAETWTELEGGASNTDKFDINTGVKEQILAIGFELCADDPDDVSALRCGIDVVSEDADGSRIRTTGGFSIQTPIMLKFSNRWKDSATAADVTRYGATGKKYDGTLTLGDPIYRDHEFFVFKANGNVGMSYTAVDDDANTQNQVFPISMKGVEDTDRTEGAQLYEDYETITKIA